MQVLIVSTLFALLLSATMSLAQVIQTSRPYPIGEAYWKTQDYSIKFNNTTMNQVFSVNGTFKRVIMLQTDFTCQVKEDPVIDLVPGTCYTYKCTGQAGKSELWDAYYSAPNKEEKVARLALAIKGIGKTSSESLVNNRYFQDPRRHPKTWEQFASEIERAANNGVITPQVKAMVLNKYAEDNIRALGYSDRCGSQAYACNIPVVVREGRSYSYSCPKKEEVELERVYRSYAFKVTSAALLDGETEAINLRLSGDPRQARIVESFYNDYSLSLVPDDGMNARANYVLTATQRKQVDLPSTALEGVQLIPVDKTNARVQISVAPFALPNMTSASSQESLMASVEVRVCKTNFTGRCGFSWDNKRTVNVRLSRRVSLVDVEVPATLASNIGNRKFRMEVEVKLYKENSLFHKANPVAKTTETITLQ